MYKKGEWVIFKTEGGNDWSPPKKLMSDQISVEKDPMDKFIDDYVYVESIYTGGVWITEINNIKYATGKDINTAVAKLRSEINNLITQKVELEGVRDRLLRPTS